MKDLEYEEVLKLLSKQHDNVEERKRRSREKIAAIWGEKWEVEFEDNEMPPWQSEHFLQYMFAFAKESPRQGHVLPVLREAVEARVKKSRYTRKGKSLMAQDVKWVISEVRRREDERLASSAASEVPSSDGIATSAVGDALVAPPPRKQVRLHYDQDDDKESVVEPVLQGIPAASASATSIPVVPHEQDDELIRRRLLLEKKWPEKAIEDNLNAVEVAVQSLTSERGEIIPPRSMKDCLILLQEYIKL